MFSKKKLLFIGLFLLVVVIGWFFVKDASQPEKYSFGYQPFGSNLTFFVAMEKGFFDEKNIQIEPVKIISANDAATGLINGDIIGNATLPLNVILNIEENQKNLFKIFMVKATSNKTWSDYLLLKADSDIEKIQDLEGKKIGSYPGSAQRALLKIILSKSIVSNNFEIIELPPSTQIQALETGQVDAILTYDQMALLALTNGVAKILVENPLGKYVVDPLYGFPYVFSTSFVKDHHDDAVRIRDAMYKAVDYIQSNEQEAREIMAKWSGVSIEIAQGVNLWDQVKVEEIDKKAMQDLADIYFNEGITKTKINTSSLYFK